MAIPYIMPIGFVDGITKDGVVILLTNPEESATIEEGTPVPIWTYNPGTLSSGRIRGEINAVGYVSATITIMETQLGPRWPKGQDILKRGAPVYLAQPGTFEPDESRMLTPEQADGMASLATIYADITRPKTPDRRRTGDDSRSPNGQNGHRHSP